MCRSSSLSSRRSVGGRPAEHICRCKPDLRETRSARSLDVLHISSEECFEPQPEASTLCIDNPNGLDQCADRLKAEKQGWDPADISYSRV